VAEIKMVCRLCKRWVMDERSPSDPTEAVVRETECPKCNIGGWSHVKWFDAAGNRTRVERGGKL
jgi:hypothetical protein